MSRDSGEITISLNILAESSASSKMLRHDVGCEKMKKWILIITLAFVAAFGSYVLMSIRRSGSFELWIEDCLSALMSGDRTVAFLDIEKSRYASLDFTIRSHTPWETYRFSTVGKSVSPDLEQHPIWQTQVDITVSNRGPLSFEYPDPTWVYSTTNTHQKASIVRPNTAVPVYSGPFRDFALSMQPNGKRTRASLQITFSEELTTRDQFRLHAVWADGP